MKILKLLLVVKRTAPQIHDPILFKCIFNSNISSKFSNPPFSGSLVLNGKQTSLSRAAPAIMFIMLGIRYLTSLFALIWFNTYSKWLHIWVCIIHYGREVFGMVARNKAKGSQASVLFSLSVAHCSCQSGILSNCYFFYGFRSRNLQSLHHNIHWMDSQWTTQYHLSESRDVDEGGTKSSNRLQ